MDPINPVAGNPEALNQNPQTPVMPKDNHGITIAAMAIFVLLALGAVAFLYFQNQQLKNLLASYQTPAASPTSVATSDPTAGWKTYTDPQNQFSFKYPDALKLDTSLKNVVKVTFIGPVQLANGKTDAGLIDGYTFAIQIVASASGSTIEKQAQISHNGALAECPENSSVGDITQVTLAGLSGETYSGTCMVDYVNYFISNSKNIYEISESIAGTTANKIDYKKTVDQILSTFKFSSTSSPSAGLSCTYNSKTYKNGEGFKASDGCNSCSCVNGQIACTLMACSQ